MAVMTAVPERQTGKIDQKNMIEVRDLRFTYPGGQHEAVKGLSFSIRQGEIFGFLGPSGAGKSTTQKILIGLLKGYSGSVSILGRDLAGWGQAYYEQIGVSFELPNHYLKLTALENLNFFRSLYTGQTEDPMRLLEMVGLADDAKTLVSQFSKGMKMRLNFARSLINCPLLLYLDEPTSGLDPVNSKLIKDIIRQKQDEGTTVFMTTHNMNVAEELCDRVAFITDGEIKTMDSPRALKLKYGRRSVQVEYHEGGRIQSREFTLDGLGSNANFLNLLRDHEVETIHTQETTLENIFIQVTGRGLE